MGELVDIIIQAVPETLVIVSGLMPMSNAENEQASVNTYNPGLKSMVTHKNQREGKNVWFLDMHNGFITTADMTDGLHPNDNGHQKMARMYFDALVSLRKRISNPRQVVGVNDVVTEPIVGEVDTTCQKVPGQGSSPITIQQGSGTNDGTYIHRGVARGIFLEYEQGAFKASTSVLWADLNGDGIYSNLKQET